MKNEIEQIAQQNKMSIEFVTWFFNKKKSACGEHWFLMLGAMWEGWKGRSIEMDRLAAENVGLKAGRKFFMYSDDAGFETYQTREEAIKAAEEMIDDYRGDAGDGWPEEAGTTRWGVIIQQATECDYEKPSAENGWMGSCDYRLLPETPATDRIVAGIKADEEKAVLNDLLRHLDKIDIENISSPWELSSEVVAFVNSRLLREEADK